MIKLYKDLNVYDFRNEFEGLDNTTWADEWQALGVLYDYLEGSGDEMCALNVRDWLRFQVMEMTADEIKEHYSNIFEDCSDMIDFLNDYSVVYGTYELDGIIYYLFSEF